MIKNINTANCKRGKIFGWSHWKENCCLCKSIVVCCTNSHHAKLGCVYAEIANCLSLGSEQGCRPGLGGMENDRIIVEKKNNAEEWLTFWLSQVAVHIERNVWLCSIKKIYHRHFLFPKRMNNDVNISSKLLNSWEDVEEVISGEYQEGECWPKSSSKNEKDFVLGEKGELDIEIKYENNFKQ